MDWVANSLRRPHAVLAIPAPQQTLKRPGAAWRLQGRWRTGPPRSRRSYLESEFQVSWIAFHDPSFCFFQTQTYLPFSVTSLPSGPLYESS